MMPSGDLHPLRYLAAVLGAVPVGGILWLELLYLTFGITGHDAPASLHLVFLVAAFGLAAGWPLRGTRRPAEVVVRSCRLGVVVALLLPIVAVTVLLLWQNASGRRDLGMGGLMLYNVPIIAFVLALVLSATFWVIGRVAERRLQGAAWGGP
ncbi:MAG TPA: hypothetical protein VMK53_04590 [Gemmatimonadales bacterium]|nr:hypothetical protein [Gemmatimonadales bacterium]